MNLQKSNRILIATLLLSVTANANGFAQQSAETEGIVRFTRSAPRQTVGQNIQQTNNTQNMGQQTAVSTEFSPTTYNGSNGNCENGTCPAGTDCNQGQCPNCQNGRGCRFHEHYCKHSPDYGYSPPAKYPLHRRGIEYKTYYPSKWYGAGGDYIQSQAPMIYQPTDTTQLGFYYQHVPTWQPQPNRLPARPIPSQWHITAPAVSPSRFCRGSSCYGASEYTNASWQTGTQQSLFGTFRTSNSLQEEYPSTEWYPMNTNTVTPAAPTPVPQAIPPSTTDKSETVPPIGGLVPPSPTHSSTTAIPPRRLES